MSYDTDISVLKDQALIETKVNGDEVEFLTFTGKRYKLYHRQDCCEHVYLDEVIGDVNDLIGLVVEAEEVSSKDMPFKKMEGYSDDYEPESYTWTFYKVGTTRGSVTFRFYGTSNGYYSERAEFAEVE